MITRKYCCNTTSQCFYTHPIIASSLISIAKPKFSLQQILQEMLDYDNDDNLYHNDIPDVSGDDSDYDDILQGIG